jgi:hypothetical protein
MLFLCYGFLIYPISGQLAQQIHHRELSVFKTRRWPCRIEKGDNEPVEDSFVSHRTGSLPPFGRNRIMSEQEIDLVTDFIHTL